MRSVLVFAFLTAAATAQAPTEVHKAHHENIKHSNLEKLSPEAQTAGKKIHEIFEKAHKEIQALIESLPQSVREELKSLKGGHSHHKKEFTEEEKAAFHKQFEEKLAKLSDEAKAAAKKIHEIREAHKDDHKAAKEAIDKELESLPEKVREELKSLHQVEVHHTNHHRGERHTTPAD